MSSENVPSYPEPAGGTVEWCLGLPLAAHRPLCTSEKAELSAEAKELRRAGWLWGCLAPPAFLIPFAILAPLASGLKEGGAADAVGTALTLVVIVPAALLFVRFRDFRQRQRGLHLDLSSGYVKCFAGPMTEILVLTLPDLPWPTDQPRDAAAKAPSLPTPETVLDVLPQSHRLWKINGQKIPKWHVVSWKAVAPPPPSAATVAAWVEPYRAQEGGPGHAAGPPVPIQPEQHGRRDLSPAEKVELGPRIKRLWLQPLSRGLFFNIWVGGSFLVGIFEGAKVALEPIDFLGFGMLILADLTFLRRAKLASQLRRDETNGYVVVLRLAGKAAREADADNPAKPGSTGPAETVVELLPLSKLLWTKAGAPAPWRKLATD